MRILLILPCNKGAKEGNFFPYGAWKQASNSLRKRKIPKDKVFFAAVDSIITKFDPVKDRKNKGAIVLETEMDRVKGYDFKPKWNEFRKNSYKLLKSHTKHCKIGMERLMKEYSLIIVCISVRGYKYSIVRALLDIGNEKLPSNTILIDCGESPSFQNNCISIATQLIKNFLEKSKIPYGYIIRPKKLDKNSRFLYRPQDLPKKYIYWDKDFYKNDSMIMEIKRK